MADVIRVAWVWRQPSRFVRVLIRFAKRMVRVMGKQEKTYDLPPQPPAGESPSYRLYHEKVAPHIRK